MALAKKCDICGRLYENCDKLGNEDNPNGIALVNIDDEGEFGCDEAMDCCPDCMQAILAVINERRENESDR